MGIETLQLYVETSLNADAIKGVIDTLRLSKVWIQTLFEIVEQDCFFQNSLLSAIKQYSWLISLPM